MRNFLVRCGLVLLPVTVLAAPAGAQTQQWLVQFGTTTDDETNGLAPDGAGGVFACGTTQANLGGSYFGNYDAWLARYDSAGNRAWIKQFGTGTWDLAGGLAEDGAGGAYVAGRTAGSLGGPHVGGGASNNVWLARYDSAGTRTWIVQFGSGANDLGGVLAPDGPGGVFIAGSTEGSLGGPYLGGAGDVWLARYDGAGNRAWIRQFGTFASDFAGGLASDDAGGVYISGIYEPGFLYDAFIARYDGAGNQLWLVPIATISHDQAYAAARDGVGGVYVAGITNGNLGGPQLGAGDAWLARYSSAGNQLWIRQIGTPQNDWAYALASAGTTGVFVGGRTTGHLGGTNAGALWTSDGWLARYDLDGSQTWIHQFGTSAADQVSALGVGTTGGLFAGGYTAGPLGGPNAGGQDCWLARLSDGCYPDCTADGALTVADFGCFQTKFVAADPYADCNADGTLTVADFGCFQTKFVAGCP